MDNRSTMDDDAYRAGWTAYEQGEDDRPDDLTDETYWWRQGWQDARDEDPALQTWREL